MVTNSGASDKTNPQGHVAGAEKFSNEQVAVQSEVDVNGTTKFVESTIVQQQVYNSDYTPTMLIPVRDQTISDFLMKPQIIDSGSWPTSFVSKTVLTSGLVSYPLENIQIWKNKLEGFGLIRGTAVIRIVINANPFQQGKLILSFVPGAASDNPVVYRYHALASITQLPNVEIDCRDAACVMEIPYIAPTEYFALHAADDYYGWGSYTLNVLSPLQVGSGGETLVHWTMYMHFEDVELAAPIAPQSSGNVAGGARPRRSKMVSTRTEATSIASGSPVSSALLVAADVAGRLAGIPAISALAAPASWMARGAAGVASWFGWAKPLDDRPTAKVSRLNLGGMPNATGVSGASNLGLYHDSTLAVLPSMAGNDFDEMSFNYLKVRKAYVGEVQWNVTDGEGTLLLSSNTDLPGEDYTTPDGDVVQYLPPYAYITKFFRAWRGSVVYTFKFVKTDFHSGRLSITFTPYPANEDPSLVNSTLCLREIIDVRGKSEFSISVPYLLHTAYQRPGLPSGTLTIRVLNELRAPTTVSSYVTMLIYMAAGDDYEVAIPGSGSTAPLPMVPQIGGVDASADQMIVSGVVGGYDITPINMEPSSQCVGEMFTSVKQLITKYTPMVTAADIASTTASIGVYPFVMQTCFRSSITENNVQPPLTGDALSYFALGYAFFRGGVKILDCPDVTTAQTPVVMEAALSFSETDPDGAVREVLAVDTDFSNFFNAKQNLLTVSLAAVQVKCLNAHQVFDPINGLEVSVPYYCRTRMSLTRGGFWDSPSYTPKYLDTPQPYLRIQRKAGQATFVHKLYRACADDFQLAYFLGFPPVWKTRSV